MHFNVSGALMRRHSKAVAVPFWKLVPNHSRSVTQWTLLGSHTAERSRAKPCFIAAVSNLHLFFCFSLPLPCFLGWTALILFKRDIFRSCSLSSAVAANTANDTVNTQRRDASRTFLYFYTLHFGDVWHKTRRREYCKRSRRSTFFQIT